MLLRGCQTGGRFPATDTYTILLLVFFTYWNVFISSAQQRLLLDDQTTFVSQQTIIGDREKAITQVLNGQYAVAKSKTERIPVNIQLQPAEYLRSKAYLATKVNVTAVAEILDDKYKNTTLTYKWSVRDKIIPAYENASKVVFHFDMADENNFLQVLVVNNAVVNGSSKKEIVVRDPITIEAPVGKLFLEHGELLSVSLKFNGTGPFKYCLKICENKEGNECKCSMNSHTYAKQLDILKYLRRVGNYTLAFAITNIATSWEKQYMIKVTDTFRKPSIPYIPIVCSISAVLIILTGLVLHLKLRRAVYTETANFDFIRQAYDEEEWDDQIQSFRQRVWCLLFREESHNANNCSIHSSISTSRTRLI